ncbi:MAG: hypothetical protein F4227_08080 [Gammaproteobacteria bacterium]|nr:hypothetical protein [Gammaproteobacteria bacterium]MYF02909.1 hypothetical protein [Gammaproteobacteria bacterium]MYI78174.1 hypothetical protein [Gammaproteobacteria bacterium]
MKSNSRAKRWLWGVNIGIVVAVAVVCVLIFTNNRTGELDDESLTSTSSSVESSSLPSTSDAAVAVVEALKLPVLEFPDGSIEEQCDLNDFPPHWATDENFESNDHPDPDELASEECWSALEDHVDAMNPYLFLWGEELYQTRAAAFVVLENPLTFERIFTDPTGDLAKVQDALSRPECLLTGDDTNWELKESCHAEAILNYALINRFCFEGWGDDRDGIGRRNRTYYFSEDNPTTVQDRLMWKQDLEDSWVRRKCEELDSSLWLTEHQDETFDLVLSLEPDKYWPNGRTEEAMIDVGWSYEPLIELAARLGDEAAGLTYPFSHSQFQRSYEEQGYKYGRFSGLLTSREWLEFATRDEPNTDRFLQTFHMLAQLSARRPDPREEIKFDWEWVARHLCEPPYDESELYDREDEETPESKSCKEIVHEIRQRDLKFAPLLQSLDKFEQIAIELGVYE